MAFAPTVLYAKLPEQVDFTYRQLAYGRRAVPKLVSELSSPELIVRQRALVSLSDLFHKPEHVSEGLDEGVMTPLVQLSQAEEISVRQKATEIFSIYASHALGRQAIIDAGAIPVLSKLFQDHDTLVRLHVHTTLARVTICAAGAREVLLQHLVATLVTQVPLEPIPIQVLILETLYNCIRKETKQALETKAMTMLTRILVDAGSPSPLKVAAIRCVLMLSFAEEGKTRAVQEGTIDALIQLLEDRKPEVRAVAAGALMSITIDIEAKKIVIKKGVLTLVKLLHDPSDNVKLNVIQTIANCAEDHRGRFFFAQSALDTIRVMSEQRHDNDQIVTAARRAIQVITWAP